MEFKLCSVHLLALALVALLCSSPSVDARRSNSHSKNHDGSEDWGYVEVRPKAHLFWWLYRSPYRVEDPKKPWPIVLWLQGGPGSSGVGIGNFQEIGPLDTNLKPRNSTWLHAADLLFVDNPVGTGYSFVEEEDLLVKTDEEAANDLTKLLMNLFNRDSNLQKSPLYLVAESYGGRFAVTTALSVLKAIELGKLKLTLGGVSLGNSWISPEDFVLSWGPLLKDLSMLDENGLKRATSVAEKIKLQISEGKYIDATLSWSTLEDVITQNSFSVDSYNFLLDSDSDPLGSVAADPVSISSMRFAFRRYSARSTLPGSEVDMDTFMNGPIRRNSRLSSPLMSRPACGQLLRGAHVDVNDFALRIHSKFGSDSKESSFQKTISETTLDRLSGLFGSFSLLPTTEDTKGILFSGIHTQSSCFEGPQLFSSSLSPLHFEAHCVAKAVEWIWLQGGERVLQTLRGFVNTHLCLPT